MKFTFNHNNFNVLDLDRSISFYEKALGLKPVREKVADMHAVSCRIDTAVQGDGFFVYQFV